MTSYRVESKKRAKAERTTRRRIVKRDKRAAIKARTKD